MRITKLEHACVLLEERGHRCYIDPGKFTTPITNASQVDAVVITHEHDDHWTPEQLARITAQSPGLTVVTTKATAERIHAAGITDIRTVITGKPGASYEVGGFKITCFGGKHAQIHSSIPVIDNLGVLINNTFAYAGDAYDLPPAPVAVLALPEYGPWMRMAESMDYLAQVRAQHVFGVHEMLLAAPGKALAAARFADIATQVGSTYHNLAPYDTLEV